ncbi:hypothetical protein Ctob_005517, partial [Chrysochromulina tobinii]
MRKSLGAFSPTKAFDTSLKKQFEQQSEQVAVLLSSLQKVTIELEEARDSTKKQVADARQESKEALKAADARAAEVNDEMIALQKQHEDEVREMSELLEQVQQQWNVKKEQYAWLVSAIKERGVPTNDGANGHGNGGAVVDSAAVAAAAEEIERLRAALDQQAAERAQAGAQAEAALAELKAAAQAAEAEMVELKKAAAQAGEVEMVPAASLKAAE